MLARALTFSTASAAVGEHTPPEQVMFCVGSVEITTSACAEATKAQSAAAAEQASRAFMTPRPSVGREPKSGRTAGGCLEGGRLRAHSPPAPPRILTTTS